MSLIIEDKNALDSLANAIIGANGSVDKTSATKGELTDIINGIIPSKSKFASGVFTPSENLTRDSKVWIDFAVGKDENGTYLYRNGDIDETDANSTFLSVHNYLRETEAYKDTYSSFLNISYSTPENSSTPVETAEKTKSLDIVFCDGNDIVKAGSLYTVLFIGYTYNPTLVDYYFDHSELDKDVGIISGNDIKFDDDIDSMTVDFVSNKVGS